MGKQDHLKKNMFSFALLAIIAVANAVVLKDGPIQPKLVAQSGSMQLTNVKITPIAQVAPTSSLSAGGVLRVGKPGELCPMCVKFFDDSLDILLNVILNGGVLGSCSELCGYLPQQLEAEVCNILCDIAGLMAFVDLLQEADPDPIYLCESIDKTCPINDNAKANITELAVTPTMGQQGTTFTVGTGELSLAFQPPQGDGQSCGTANLLVETPPGIYQIEGQLATNMPSMQEPFNPGMFCEGTCGSKWPHSFILSRRQTTFTITS